MLHSSWPTALSLALVGYLWLLVVLRVFSFHATALDRAATFALGILALTCSMREPTLQGAMVSLSGLSPAFYFQFAMILMGAAVGFNVLTFAAALGRNYRPVLVHCLALASALIASLCGAEARARGVAIEDVTGWGQLGFWLALLPMTVWLDVLMLKVCLAELRKQPDGREYLVHAGLALFPLIHLIAFSAAPIAAVFLVRNEHTIFASVLAAGDRDSLIYQAAVIALGLTVPSLLRVATRLGLDEASRSRKRLLPLWADLTAVCPEVVYRDPVVDGLGSRFLLHRTVIEIRDCLHALSRYTEGDRGDDHSVADYAVRLAQACRAKSAGAAPVGSAYALPSTAGDVEAEIDELTALAAQWKRARAVAGYERTMG
ncbi:MAB_1171c family putative transporter [Nocardia altamirensis]|uniref:MAB_1171c family putative transporter n=1 Tax=Nocardia altamirensis TaxID=472158 RepID=UPI0008408F32|nr:MAB_1171c family putative transporter [Nocardia altamirensis]